MSSHGGSGDQSVNNPAARQESRKPKYSKFTQQELPACKPLLTPCWVIITFFLVCVVFVPIGAVTLAASRSVVEVAKRYEIECLPSLTNAQREAHVRNGTTDKNCTVTLKIPKDMKAPVYVYYQLSNFYQNHRRYVKSRSDKQLRGDNVTSLSECSPEDYLGDNTSFPINPCGLIAWSYFNDTYSLTRNGIKLPVDETGIAWSSDKKDKFGTQRPQNFNTDPNLRGGGTLPSDKPLNENEHLIVWMRTAALPTFRKLWGKLNVTLKANETITIQLENLYNTYSFNGKKEVVLSTTSWLGGKNDFLGIAYLTVGILCFFISAVFALVHLKAPRPLGDTSYLSWNRKNGAPPVAGAS